MTRSRSSRLPLRRGGENNAAHNVLIADALAPRLGVAAEVARELRSLRDGNALTQMDRGILETLVKRYDALT